MIGNTKRRNCAALVTLIALCSCIRGYEHLNFEEIEREAIMLFQDTAYGQGKIEMLPDYMSYTRSLDPDSIYLSNDGVSYTLDRGFLETTGIFILKKGYPDRGTDQDPSYRLMSGQTFKWLQLD